MADQTQIQWNEVPDQEYAGGDFIKFNNIGDQTIGFFQGRRQKEGRFGPETILDFEGYQGAQPFSLTATSDLKAKTADLEVGLLVRITFKGTKDTGKQSPLRIFKVDTARVPRTAAPAPQASRPASAAADVPF